MPRVQLDAILRHLHGLAGARGADELSDRQLLERFAAGRDEEAFAALMRRHGPMVLGVCRRLLGQEQDAEDAFQATFLVLARKAGSTRWDTSVASWLHKVACRLAAEARGKTARQRHHERQAAHLPRAESLPEETWRELSALLDQELGRLPERYRRPLLLCYLEGETRDRAARQLGWSLRTLERRLHQGRELLRERLTARGLTLPAGMLALALAESGAPGAVPALLAAATTRAAVLFAAGGQLAAAGVSTKVTALVEGVVKSMATSKLKMGIAWTLALGILAVGTGGVAHQLLASKQQEPVAKPAPREVEARAPAAAGDGPEVKQLLRERQEAWQQAVQAMQQEFLAGRITADRFLEGSKLLREAELELARTPAERRAAQLAHFKRMALADETLTAGFLAMRIKAADFYSARAERLAAEVALRRASGTPPGDVKPPLELKRAQAEWEAAQRRAEEMFPRNNKPGPGFKPDGKP